MSRRFRLSFRIATLLVLLGWFAAAPPAAWCSGAPREEPPGAAEARDTETACWDHLGMLHGGSAEAASQSVTQEIREFKPLVEQSLAHRAETIKVAQRLKDQIRAGKPLSGEDLDTLNNGVVAHLTLRERLFAVAEAHECWLDAPEESFAKLGLPPESRLKGVMLSLAAALTLYDNYLLAISLYEEDSKLRQFLNRRDSGYAIGRAELAKVTLQYNSLTNRKRIRSGMSYYQKGIRKSGPSFQDDPDAGYLGVLIEQSPSYAALKGLSPLTVFGRELGFLGGATHDTLQSLAEEGVNLFSMLFGNTIGLVESRKGKLFGRNDVASFVKSELRAGDILIEKTPFRLSDKLIPGYWGHAAVWLGTEEEQRGLGIWDDPVVRKYHDPIREGRLIVEALRSGVEMNTLEHFLNIDDMAVLRVPGLKREDTAKVVVRALRQVGKPYDFNFNAETTDRIYCSKLVYIAHTEIQWPTDKTLGRATVSPDHVASRALKGGPLEVVALFHDGEAVREDRAAHLAGLMADGSTPKPSWTSPETSTSGADTLRDDYSGP